MSRAKQNSTYARLHVEQRNFLNLFRNSYIRAVRLNQRREFIEELCDIFFKVFPMEKWSLLTKTNSTPVSELNLEKFYSVVADVNMAVDQLIDPELTKSQDIQKYMRWTEWTSVKNDD